MKFLISLLVSTLIFTLINQSNLLVKDFTDYYLSINMLYTGLILSFCLIISYHLICYCRHNRLNNINIFISSLTGLVVVFYLIREQFMVDDIQYLRYMIPNHSSSIYLSEKILEKSNNQEVRDLANQILNEHEQQLKLMKNLIKA